MTKLMAAPAGLFTPARPTRSLRASPSPVQGKMELPLFWFTGEFSSQGSRPAPRLRVSPAPSCGWWRSGPGKSLLSMLKEVPERAGGAPVPSAHFRYCFSRRPMHTS